MENRYRNVADRLFVTAILSVLLVALSGESQARDKTDVIFLKNGDRVTGEIKSLERGRLKVSTDSLGTLLVEWDDVASLESQYQFEFEDSGGELLVGTIVHSEAEKIRLQGPNRTVDLDLYSLVRISPLEALVRERFDGSWVSVGFDFTRANRRKRWVAEAGLRYRVPQYLVRATISSLVTHQDEGEDANRQVLDLDWIYNLGGRWYAAGLFQASHNDHLDLDVRTTLGGALGRRILQTNQATLSVFAGAQLNRERFFNQPSRRTVEAIIHVELQQFRFDTPKLDITTTLDFLPNLNDSGRFRTDLTSSIRYEVVSDLFFGIRLFDNFDSDPPGGIERNDFGVLTTVGYSF